MKSNEQGVCQKTVGLIFQVTLIFKKCTCSALVIMGKTAFFIGESGAKNNFFRNSFARCV